MMLSLTSRAEAILADAKTLDAYFEANNIPYPSFDVDTMEKLPNELQNERKALTDTTHDLTRLVRGAPVATMDIVLAWTESLPLRIIDHYNLASAVPVDGSASYAEIAAASGLKEALCFRFLRAAMSSRIFAEDPATGRVRHTAMSRLLVTDAGLRDTVGFTVDDMEPSATKLVELLERHGGKGVDEIVPSPFSMCHGCEQQSMYDFLTANPERGRRFGSAMRFLSQDGAWDLRDLLRAFEWPALDRPGAVLVDVGGGHGHVSQLLARHTHNLRFVVHELPDVVATAQTTPLPEDVRDRISFTAHDFFSPQPPPAPEQSGRTAFLLSRVLHNWSDKYCVRILQSLVPALRPGDLVLIFDFMLYDGPVTEMSRRVGLQMDMIMATLLNSRERAARDFEVLLRESDERYVLEAVRRPEGSTMGLVEVGWNG